MVERMHVDGSEGQVKTWCQVSVAVEEQRLQRLSREFPFLERVARTSSVGQRQCIVRL